MEKAMIEKLIDTAIKQLDFSYTPYSGFKVGAALLTKREKYTQAAILKMHPTRLQTVQSGQLFSKQSVKESGIFRPSVL